MLILIFDSGSPMSAETKPFNEYYLLAYLAMLHEKPGSTIASVIFLKSVRQAFFKDAFKFLARLFYHWYGDHKNPSNSIFWFRIDF